MRVATPLAYVRLADGGTVTLQRGEPVPPEADQEHVDQLTGKGVLVDGGVEILDDAGEPIALAPLPDPVEDPPPPADPPDPPDPAVMVDDPDAGKAADTGAASPPKPEGRPRPPRGGPQS